MQTYKYSIPQDQLAARLKRRRVAEGLTQQAAADEAKMARTTLIAIEQGKRPVRPAELQQLAYVYKTSANLLLARAAANVQLEPQFRRLCNCSQKELHKARYLLERLVEAELRFEDILGLDSGRNYSPAEFSGSDDSWNEPDRGAEKDAGKLRDLLKIGLAPVQNMFQLIECGLNMRLYISPLDSGISGLWAPSSHGSCMLLNAKHAIERIYYSAAHELGHFVWSLRGRDPHSHKAQEAYANHFASNFLMPESTTRDYFERLQSKSEEPEESPFTTRNLIMLSHTFNVSCEAMACRLENLKIFKEGTWQRMEDRGGISKGIKDSALSDSDAESSALCKDSQYKLQRIYRLAINISEKELLSEGQLSRLLCLDRLELREILHQ